MAAAADVYAGLVRANENPGDINRRNGKMKGATAIGRGWLTCTVAGFVGIPSVANAAAKCNGVSMDNVDNSGGADGDLSIGTEDGVFDYKNDAVNPCTQADVGNEVYGFDHETIANNAGRGPKIGTLEAFNPDGAMPGRPCRVRVIMSR